jgi:hypothetical protein
VVEVDFIFFDGNARGSSLNVDSISLAAEDLVVRNNDRVLRLGLDHNAATFEKRKRAFFDENITIHTDNTCGLTIITQVTFESRSSYF